MFGYVLQNLGESNTIIIKNLILQGLRKGNFSDIDLTPELTILRGNTEDQEAWNMLYKKIIYIFKQKLKRSNDQVIFLEAYYMLNIEDKKWAVMSRALELMGKNLNFRETYRLILLKHYVEKKMTKDQNKKDKSLIKVVQYESLTTEFNQKVYIIALLKKRFWSNLQSEHPNFNQLSKLSGKMSKLKLKIHSIYKELTKIKERNLQTMKKYGAYLYELEANFRKASEIFQKIVYADGLFRNKKTKDTDKIENSGIIVITGDFRQKGVIINVNDEAVRLLGYR